MFDINAAVASTLVFGVFRDHLASTTHLHAPGCHYDRDRMADYLSMVADLRNAGIRAEVYLGNPKNFGNQLKYADKRNSPVAVIEGGAEKEAGVVQIKDLILGAEIAKNATMRT